jgi:siroheme synthase-like protein
MNKYMPVNLFLQNRHWLIVGGGEVALRKIETLLDYDCLLTVIAPEVSEKINYYNQKKKLSLEQRDYASPESSLYDFVIAAANEEVNLQVYKDCKKARVLVNVVDNPALCDYIFPAMLKRGILNVAISTDGEAPFLAGHLKLVLENVFPEHWSRLSQMAADFRKKVRHRWGDDKSMKSECYQKFLIIDWKDFLARMSDSEIEAELDRLIEK